MRAEPNRPPRGYSTRHAAELLGISLRTLQRRMADGTIYAVPLGPRKLIVPESEIRRLLRTPDEYEAA